MKRVAEFTLSGRYPSSTRNLSTGICSKWRLLYSLPSWSGSVCTYSAGDLAWKEDPSAVAVAHVSQRAMLNWHNLKLRLSTSSLAMKWWSSPIKMQATLIRWSTKAISQPQSLSTSRETIQTRMGSSMILRRKPVSMVRMSTRSRANSTSIHWSHRKRTNFTRMTSSETHRNSLLRNSTSLLTTS